MSVFRLLFLSTGLLSLLGCSPVKLPAANEYQLSAYSAKSFKSQPHSTTLLVSTPDAVAGYQTAAMLYMKKPFQIEAFAKNAWISPPADMLYPLLVQSLQRSGYFYAVVSSPYNATADYRLDSQLLALKQNFLSKPSVLEFAAKVVLTRNDDHKVIASRIINICVPCPTNTPYGGVIAANNASLQFTALTTAFVVSHISH